MEGRAGAVKALLGAAWKDQILNVTNDEGWTPLMQAAAAGHAQVCKQLLEAGAYVRCETRSQTTPLHYVARWLPEKERDTNVIILIIDLFLSCGAPVNAANAHGVTPLHEAAQMGSHEVVRFLLKRGANPAVRAFVVCSSFTGCLFLCYIVGGQVFPDTALPRGPARLH